MIFSENYFTADRYDLNTETKISTIEMMPRRFTSLENSRYLPSLSDIQKEKLNLYFDFEQVNTTDPNYNWMHDLYVEHNAGEIISFFARKEIRYSTISNYHLWNKFIDEIKVPELNNCKSHIERMTDVTAEPDTYITGLVYNEDMSLYSVRVCDRTYNLSEYNDNEFLNSINEIPNKMHGKFRGEVAFRPDSNDINYHLTSRYDLSADMNYLGKGMVKIFDDRNSMVDMYLDFYSQPYTDNTDFHIITSEQAAFIRSVCTGNSYFTLDFHIDETGVVNNTTFLHFKVEKFVDLTTS